MQKLMKSTTEFARRRRLDATHFVLGAVAVGLLLSLIKQQNATQAAETQAGRYARVAMWAMSERERDMYEVGNRTNDMLREMALHLAPENAEAFKGRLPLPRISGPDAKPPTSPSVDAEAVLEVHDLLAAWREQAQ